MRARACACAGEGRGLHAPCPQLPAHPATNTQDPAGAVVGRFCSKIGLNRAWYENKTVAGTAAVLAFAFASLSIPAPLPRLGVAALCALAEAFGGKTHDNAAVAVPALGSWIYYHGWR